MRRLTWAKITAGVALAYGVFLIIQAFVQVWPEEIYDIVKFAGGVLFILWAGIFWKLK